MKHHIEKNEKNNRVQKDNEGELTKEKEVEREIEHNDEECNKYYS